jgi:protein-disulfide isomerase
MVEEKTEKHEQHHEASESKTITLKKSTLWAIGAFALLVLLVISIFTGGFGITGKAANTDNNNTGTGAVDTKVFTSNQNLYPSLGPDNAKVTVIEFADFQCPFCAIASGLPSWLSQYASQYADVINSAGKLEELAKQGEIRLIYVPFSFLGEESINAAEAGLCANEQNKFWEMHDAIFTAHDGKENNGKYTVAKLEIIAQSISGLNQAEFKTCLESDKYSSQMSSISQATGSAGISGTPAFLVNGKQVSASWTELQAAINAA